MVIAYSLRASHAEPYKNGYPPLPFDEKTFFETKQAAINKAKLCFDTSLLIGLGLYCIHAKDNQINFPLNQRENKSNDKLVLI